MAAQLLGMSEKTVRAWVDTGALRAAQTPSPHLLLDVERVHHVLHLVQDLRAAGATAGLLDQAHQRLTDACWFDRADLAQSLAQLRRGEGSAIATAVHR